MAQILMMPGFIELMKISLSFRRLFLHSIVDTPFTFGQVAAANALSDVYAMEVYPHSACDISIRLAPALTGQ